MEKLPNDVFLGSVNYDEENSIWVCSLRVPPVDYSDKPDTYIAFRVFSGHLYFSETGELLRASLLS